MSAYNLKYSPYSSRAILIEWPSIIDEKILSDILNYKNALQNEYIQQKLEIISAYNSLLIKYEFTIDKFNNEILRLGNVYSNLKGELTPQSHIWKIPVCYDGKVGLDLEYLSKKKELSISEIIDLHIEPVYTVFFIGFLPGFLYLGGLEKRLHIDRKKVPSPKIEKGAVAIGGEQTGIYPQESPGGWHVIGNSPINFFNPQLNEPCFAKPGDKIQFVPITMDKHRMISKKVKSGNFTLKSKIYNGRSS